LGSTASIISLQSPIYTDKTTLKCDKEFDGKGAGARREKEKRGGEDG